MKSLSDLPKVSIITPSFNQGQFLEASIRSVLEQDYPNIEYIIVDGNSKDESGEIIKKYQNHLAWWVSEKDKGHADALNKGFSHATGEILAWLNSDDIYFPNAVSEAISVLRSHLCSQTDQLSTNAARFRPHSAGNNIFSFKTLAASRAAGSLPVL